MIGVINDGTQVSNKQTRTSFSAPNMCNHVALPGNRQPVGLHTVDTAGPRVSITTARVDIFKVIVKLRIDVQMYRS